MNDRILPAEEDAAEATHRERIDGLLEQPVDADELDGLVLDGPVASRYAAARS